MSDAPSNTVSEPTAGPRSTGAVLAILAAVVVMPLLVVLLVTLLPDGDAGGEALMEDVRTNRIQAVYMSNDSVYFGSLEASSGDWVVLRDAFFLRASAAEDAKDGETAGVTNLVPVEQQAGGDGDLLINAAEVALVQNLQADSPIATEIEDAGK